MITVSYVDHMTNHTALLDELERRIAITGLAGVETELQQLADVLVRRGVLPAIAGIVADRAAPEVARLRAIGRAARALRSLPLDDRELARSA